jgi:hypothetical protein
MKSDWWLIIVILVLALALIATKVRQDRPRSKTEVRPTAHAAPLRPNVGALVSAGAADHADLEIVEGHFIRPVVSVQFGLMMAFVVAAEDQDMASTETTHCPKRSRLWCDGAAVT